MNTLKSRMNLKKLQIPISSPKQESNTLNANIQNLPSKATISKITENVYISGYIIGKNISYLKENNFTHVINCCLGSSLSDEESQNEEALKQLYQYFYEMIQKSIYFIIFSR